MAAPTATVDLSAFNSIKRAMDTYDSVWHMRAGPWNVAKWRMIKFLNNLIGFGFRKPKQIDYDDRFYLFFFGGGGWERSPNLRHLRIEQSRKVTCNIMKDSCDPSANGLLDPNDWTTHFSPRLPLVFMATAANCCRCNHLLKQLDLCWVVDFLSFVGQS